MGKPPQGMAKPPRGMAKPPQGMAKRSGTAKGLTRRQISRSKREQLLQRWIIYGAIAAGVVAVGFIIYGFVNQYYLLPNTELASIGDRKITVAQFQKRFRLELGELNLQGIPLQYIYPDATNPEQAFAQVTFDGMVNDLVVAEKAEELKISVTDAEVEREIGLAFRYDGGTPEPSDTPTLTPSPTKPMTPTVTATFVHTLTPSPTFAVTADFAATASATLVASATPSGPTATLSATATLLPTSTPLSLEAYQAQAQSYYEQIATVTGLSATDVRSVWIERTRARLLRDRVFEAQAIEGDKTKTMIHVAHILVTTPSDAQKAKERLAAGDSFAIVAAEMSQDPGTAPKGGDQGWIDQDINFVPEYVDAAFKLEKGEVSEPVQSPQYGFFLIKVLDKSEVPLTFSQQEASRQKKFAEMVRQWREEYAVKVKAEWPTYIPSVPQIVPGG